MGGEDNKEGENFGSEEILLTKILDEVKSTEQAYIQHLNLLIQTFIDALSGRADLVKAVDLRTLFGEIRSIRLVNQVLLDSLDTYDGSGVHVHRQLEAFVDAFATLTPYLKLYSSYARNFPGSQHLLETLRRDNPKFERFLKTQESLPIVKGLKLPALMIMPIQRITRYKLFLDQILSLSINLGRIEHGKIEAIHNSICQVNDLVNDCVRDFDNTMRIIAIQNKLDSCAPKLLQPGRHLIKEGVLNKVPKSGNYRVQERMFWLFTDILLYAKSNPRSKTRFLCCCVYPLRHCRVKRILGRNVFEITCQNESLFLTGDSFALVDSWINELDKTIQDAQIVRRTLRKDSSKRSPMRRSMLHRMRRHRSTLSRRLDMMRHSQTLRNQTLPAKLTHDKEPSLVQRVLTGVGSWLPRRKRKRHGFERSAQDLNNSEKPGNLRIKKKKMAHYLEPLTEEDSSDYSISSIEASPSVSYSYGQTPVPLPSPNPSLLQNSPTRSLSRASEPWWQQFEVGNAHKSSPNCDMTLAKNHHSICTIM